MEPAVSCGHTGSSFVLVPREREEAESEIDR